MESILYLYILHFLIIHCCLKKNKTFNPENEKNVNTGESRQNLMEIDHKFL